MTYRPDLAAAFLRMLDPDAAEFDFTAIWPKDAGHPPPDGDNVMSTRATFDDMAETLGQANAAGYGVFFTINEIGGDGRRVAENVTRIRAVFADFDDGMPDEFPLPPSVIVRSSFVRIGGTVLKEKHQAYWFLDDTSISVEQFAGVMSCLVENYKADGNAKDATRIFRLPGYRHTKNAKHRPLVQVVEGIFDADGDPLRYSARQLVKAFPAPAPVAPRAVDRRAVERRGNDRRGGSHRKATTDEVSGALLHLIDKADEYEVWVRYGLAIWREFGDDGFPVWRDWSQRSRKFNERDAERKWKSFAAAGDSGGSRVTVGSIFHAARERGWKRPYRYEFNIQAVREAGRGLFFK